MSRRQSPEEKRAYNRERYHRNREKILAQQKERYDREKDRLNADGRAYYQANKETIKARAAEYYQENTVLVKTRISQQRLDRKLAAMALLGGKCRDCEMSHPAALDFHHRDPEDKLFSISDMMMSTKQVDSETFEAEVRKCDLLCKNHHAIYHSTWEIDEIS